MEKQQLLRVDASSLDTATSGAVTGRIWFEGDVAFPDAGWFDFPIVVLTWWLEILVRLLAGHSNSGELRFMDGPYRVAASVTDDGALLLQFWSGRSATPTASVTSSLSRAMDGGLSCARVLLAECKARDWTSDDIQKLEDVKVEAEMARRSRDR